MSAQIGEVDGRTCVSVAGCASGEQLACWGGVAGVCDGGVCTQVCLTRCNSVGGKMQQRVCVCVFDNLQH